MRYSVWRGTECLGHAELKPIPKPGRLRGSFTPTPAGEALGPIHQDRPSHWPGRPTFQWHLPRARENPALETLDYQVASVELRVDTAVEGKPPTPIAPEAALELRNPDGVTVPTDFLHLTEWPGARVAVSASRTATHWTLVVALSSPNAGAT